MMIINFLIISYEPDNNIYNVRSCVGASDMRSASIDYENKIKSKQPHGSSFLYSGMFIFLFLVLQD